MTKLTIYEFCKSLNSICVHLCSSVVKFLSDDGVKKPRINGASIALLLIPPYLPAISSSCLALTTWPFNAASFAERPKATDINCE